ncbi:MAG: hypothetical protein ABFS86_19505, partial [Planctomycetota bacterium]
ILVDLTAPTGTFTINDGSRYVLPAESLTLDVSATDGADGSGVVSGRVRFDGGWSDAYDLTASSRIRVADGDRPASGGHLTASLVLADEAGNESSPVDVRFASISRSPERALKRLQGTLDFPEEVESFALDLVHGDVLSVKLKYKALVKGEFADVGIDLARADGRRLVIDKFPSSLPKAGIKRYTAPETGRYYLLFYRTGGAETCRWSAKVKVKQSRDSKKVKGEGEVEVIRFPAAHGSTLKGTLSAEGITAEDIRIVGPEGEVPFEFRERTGKVVIRPTILDAGTGTWEIHVEADGPVKHKLTCARLKP